jgi:hypothetical protein
LVSTQVLAEYYFWPYKQANAASAASADSLTATKAHIIRPLARGSDTQVKDRFALTRLKQNSPFPAAAPF